MRGSEECCGCNGRFLCRGLHARAEGQWTHRIDRWEIRFDRRYVERLIEVPSQTDWDFSSILAFATAGFVLTLVPKTAEPALIVSTSAFGATAIMLGVDCFTANGLKYAPLLCPQISS